MRAIHYSLLAAGTVLAAMPAKGDAITPAGWTKFADPVEQAFTVEVPKGWTVRGGLTRKGILDPRPMVDAVSPDGRMNYRLGDASIPPYTTPGPLTMQLGFREGSPYSPGGRIQGMIAAYRNGPEFAKMYVMNRFGRTCGDLQFKTVRQAKAVVPSSFGAVSAGEVVFTCKSSSWGEMTGYQYAETLLLGDRNNGGLWTVQALFGFFAPQSDAKTAQEIMSHSVSTYRVSEQWTQAQNSVLPSVNRQLSREMDHNLKMTQDVDDIINGVTVTHDPVTGRNPEVRTSYKPYYWINSAGKVVSTSTNAPPGGDYRPLRPTTRAEQK